MQLVADSKIANALAPMVVKTKKTIRLLDLKSIRLMRVVSTFLKLHTFHLEVKWCIILYSFLSTTLGKAADQLND